jgi:hypothetical protein
MKKNVECFMKVKQKFQQKVYLPRHPEGKGMITIPWGEGTVSYDVDQIITAITGNHNVVKEMKGNNVDDENVLLKIRNGDCVAIWFTLDEEVFKLAYRLAKAGYCVDYQDVKQIYDKQQDFADRDKTSQAATMPRPSIVI